MHWFYDPSLSQLIAGEERTLIGTEGHHASGPLRIRPGELITVTNGVGLIAECEALATAKSELRYRVLTSTQSEPLGMEIWLYQALAKSDRDELAVQNATELGVFGVAAWQAARSVSRWEGIKVQKGLTRWNQICIEAAKQSQRAWFPALSEVVAEGIPANLPGLTLMLEPTAKAKLSELAIINASRVNLLVGPEGGFTEQELLQGASMGYQAARLGAEILRTSSAGPAAIALIHGITGYW